MNVFEVHIQVEPWDTFFPDFRVLSVRHWEEIAHFKDIIPLDPDWDKYAALAKAGMLSITAARRDGDLVGYLVYIVGPHLHYKSSLTASADVLYLMPEERKGITGLRLIRVAEDDLRRRGVQRIGQNVKVDNDWSPILKRMGYTPFENIFQKIVR